MDPQQVQQTGVRDTITVLTSRRPLLTKRWLADGTIEGHGKAKNHTLESFSFENIFDLAEILGRLAKQPTSCVIRGEYIGHEAAALVPDKDGERQGKFILRQAKYFTDPAHHWIMFDLDNYAPVEADPDTDPEAAIEEWIRKYLPEEFHDVTYYWQLSSSAGHPSKKGSLRAHLFYFMRRAMTSPEAHAWVTMADLPIDRAPLNVVQAHFVADPVMDAGVDDPIPVRGGLKVGFTDVVELEIDEDALAAAMLESRRGIDATTGAIGECVDPRTKHGLVGAFCRAFSIEDVLQADWFEGAFEQVNNRRFTWLDGNGAAEGAYLTDDGMRFVNTHNTAPADSMGKGVNSFDLVRVYNFGKLDDAVPEEDRWSWGKMGNRPSEDAMRKFARSLPEVQAEMDNGPEDDDNPFVNLALTGMGLEATSERPVAETLDFIDMPRQRTRSERLGREMGEQLKQRLFAMGLSEDERHRMVNSTALTNAWMGCFYGPTRSKLLLLNKEGQLVEFISKDWESQVRLTFGKFLVDDVLCEVSARLARAHGTDPEHEAKEIRKSVWDTFILHVLNVRQRSELSYRVDMFAKRPTIVLTETAAEVTYLHEDFKIKPTGLAAVDERAIIDEYRAHFDLFDTFLGLLLHARFATDRRNAFLHMQCLAGFGKGFLLQGVLGADGLNLVCEMSTKDIERAFEGAPSPIQASDFVRAWCIAVDEFKSAKSELKQLNNRISAAPKNQMRFTVEVFLKLFLSAESVDSLAGSEGVEAQFADRFSVYEMPESTPRLDDRPLFKQYGKTLYRTVIANYAAEKLNEGVERMRALGQGAACKVGDDWLEQFHREYGIANTRGLLSDHLPEIAAEFVTLMNDWALHLEGKGSGKSIDMLPNSFKLKLSQAVKVVTGRTKAGEELGRLIVTGGLSALVKDYIVATKDRSQQLLVSHKTNAIIELIVGRKANTTGYYYEEDGSQKSIRGAVLPLTQSPAILPADTEFEIDDIEP